MARQEAAHSGYNMSRSLFLALVASVAAFILATTRTLFVSSPSLRIFSDDEALFCSTGQNAAFFDPFAKNISATERLVALSSLDTVNNDVRCRFEEAWRASQQKTTVEFLIGSFDRPQELRNVLVSMEKFLIGNYRTTALFLGSDDIFLQAYHALSLEKHQHKFLQRNGDDFFFVLKEAISTSPASNFVILTDDVVFIRPCNIQRMGIMQNLLETAKRTKISVQLRTSSRDKTPPILAEIPPFNGLMPHVHVVNCSRPLDHNEPHNEDSINYKPCCYDRHIDGAMFTRVTLEDELKSLGKSGQVPRHPGELEAFWMLYARDALWEDLTIYPVDRVVMNIGIAFGTVRDDRKYLESTDDVPLKEKSRQDAAAAFLQGCFIDDPAPGAYLNIDERHATVPPLNFTC